MVNRLWYEPGPDGKDHHGLISLRNYMQELINLYCPELFTEPEDITPDNLQQFLEIMLKNYQNYNLSHNNLENLGDAIHDYFNLAFRDEFSSSYLTEYPENDKRSLIFDIVYNCMNFSVQWPLLSEDISFLLKCISEADNKVIETHNKIEKYFEQFDIYKRYEEQKYRWDIVVKQRLEALEKNQPLPIRPMGIELSLCYKEGFEPKE